MTKRKIIEKNLEDLDLTFFEGHIDSVIANLDMLKNKYSTYSNLSIRTFHQWESMSIYICGEREETDKEYNKRMAEELTKQKRKIEQQKKRQIAQEEKLNKEQTRMLELRKKYNIPDNLDVETLKFYIKELEE